MTLGHAETLSQWRIKANRIPFMKMNRIFTHCYSVLSCANRYNMYAYLCIYIYAGVSQNDEPPFVGRNHLFFGADNFEM